MLSGGAYTWKEIGPIQCEDTCDERAWDRAYWANLQLSYRHPIAAHWQVGPYVGFSHILNADDFECTDAPACGEDGDGKRLFYGGVAMGRRF